MKRATSAEWIKLREPLIEFGAALPDPLMDIQQVNLALDNTDNLPNHSLSIPYVAGAPLTGYLSRWNSSGEVTASTIIPKCDEESKERCGMFRQKVDKDNVVELGQKYFIEKCSGSYIIRHIKNHVVLLDYECKDKSYPLKHLLKFGCSLCGTKGEIWFPFARNRLAEELFTINVAHFAKDPRAQILLIRLPRIKEVMVEFFCSLALTNVLPMDVINLIVTKMIPLHISEKPMYEPKS